VVATVRRITPEKPYRAGQGDRLRPEMASTRLGAARRAYPIPIRRKSLVATDANAIRARSGAAG